MQSEKLPREQRLCRVCSSGCAEDVAHFLLDCAPLQPQRAPLLRLFAEARRDHPSLFPAEVLPREEMVLISLGKRPAVDAALALSKPAHELDTSLMRAVHHMFALRRRLLAVPSGP